MLSGKPEGHCGFPAANNVFKLIEGCKRNFHVIGNNVLKNNLLFQDV